MEDFPVQPFPSQAFVALLTALKDNSSRIDCHDGTVPSNAKSRATLNGMIAILLERYRYWQATENSLWGLIRVKNSC